MNEHLKVVEQIVQDIKDIKIQWATNIAKAAFEVIISESHNQEFSSKNEYIDFVNKSMEILIAARPTEPMLFNWMDYIKSEMDKLKSENDVKKCQELVIHAAQFYLNLINETAERAVLNGLWVINEWDNVLTHCHSSSAIKTLKLHKIKWVNFKVYNTETRPLYQGRKTSADLIAAGIDTTMVVDGVAPFLMDESSWTDLMMDCVIIWCDAIKLDWGVINKVWSYSVWLSALYANVPVYIAWNLLKVDVHDKIQNLNRKKRISWGLGRFSWLIEFFKFCFW